MYRQLSENSHVVFTTIAIFRVCAIKSVKFVDKMSFSCYSYNNTKNKCDERDGVHQVLSYRELREGATQQINRWKYTCEQQAEI